MIANFKVIDIRGIILGVLLSILGLIVMILPFTYLKIALLGRAEPGSSYTVEELILLIPFCCLWYIWSGFIVSKMSRKGKVINPLFVGFLFFVLAVFPSNEKLTLWYLVFPAMASIPFHYIGAIWHLKRVNKLKNNVPLARTPQKKRRLF